VIHRAGTPLVNWYLLEEDGRVTIVDAGCPSYRARRAVEHPAAKASQAPLTPGRRRRTAAAPVVRSWGLGERLG